MLFKPNLSAVVSMFKLMPLLFRLLHFSLVDISSFIYFPRYSLIFFPYSCLIYFVSPSCFDAMTVTNFLFWMYLLEAFTNHLFNNLLRLFYFCLLCEITCQPKTGERLFWNVKFLVQLSTSVYLKIWIHFLIWSALVM